MVAYRDPNIKPPHPLILDIPSGILHIRGCAIVGERIGSLLEVLTWAIV